MALEQAVRISDFRATAEEVATAQTASSEVAPSLMDTLVDSVMPSAGAETPANTAAAPQAAAQFQQSTWQPQTALRPDEVATGVEQSTNSAAAMGQEAEQGLGNIAAMEEDMKRGASPDQPQAGGESFSLAGAGRGLAFEAGAVAAASAVFGGPAGAALGGVMLARDAMQAMAGRGANSGADPRISQGPAAQTVTLRGQEARDFKRSGYLPSEMRSSGPTNSFEAQAGTGYGRGNNPVLESLSHGPGFGNPHDLMGRMDNTMSFDAQGISLQGTPELAERQMMLDESKAGFEQQLHISQDLTQGFQARAENGVEIQTAGELDGVSAEHARISPGGNTAYVPGHFA